MVVYQPLIGALSLAVIIEGYILIRLSWKLCFDSSVKQTICYYKFCTLSFIACAFGCTLNDILHSLTHQIEGTQFDLDESDMELSSYFRLIADIFYFLGTLILYLLFAGRLYITFRDTSYQLSPGIVTLVSIIVIITTLSETLYIAFLILQLFKVYLPEELALYSQIAIVVTDFIINITLLSLFLRKLKHVVVAQSENNLNEQLLIKQPSNDGYLLDLDTAQLKFVNIMTKMTLLSGISMMVYELHLLYLVALFLWFSHNGWAFILGYSTRTIYILSSTICIFLNFEINEDFYFKLCGKCHKSLYGLYVKDTKRQIRKSISVYQLSL